MFRRQGEEPLFRTKSEPGSKIHETGIFIFRMVHVWSSFLMTKRFHKFSFPAKIVRNYLRTLEFKRFHKLKKPTSLFSSFLNVLRFCSAVQNFANFSAKSKATKPCGELTLSRLAFSKIFWWFPNKISK